MSTPPPPIIPTPPIIQDLRVTWNYPVKYLFLLANVTIITVKMSFTHFHSRSCHIPSSKSCNLSVQTIIARMESNKWDYWRRFVTKLYLVSIAKNKDPSIRVKMHQTIFWNFYHYLPYICWVDVIYLTCHVFLKSP